MPSSCLAGVVSSRAHDWGALIVDQAVFVSEDYQDTIEHYYVGEPIPYVDDHAFQPVTGLETRPMLLYTRRTALGTD
ncbi:MAG: hypothetical protein IT320_10970 [Anaerolineae bacterium]|nr:hypothetical protein [Anaerolineae bacterium]